MHWFCWEKGDTGRWSPVLYHGRPVRLPAHESHRRTELLPVETDGYGPDGKVMPIDWFAARHPMPEATP